MRLGFNHDCAPLGEESVKAAHKSSYGLILMYVNMPIMNEQEATCVISWGNGKLAETIILGVTALIPTDRDHSTGSGINAKLAKSLTADRLARAANK